MTSGGRTACDQAPPTVLDVMLVLVDHTAIWNLQQGDPAKPAVRARMVTLNGRPVGVDLGPEAPAQRGVERAGVVVVSTSDLDLALVATSALISRTAWTSPPEGANEIDSRTRGDERLRRIEAFLQANYGRGDLSTATLAKRAGLGERTFVRHFKAATGKTPTAYLQALRIQAAKAMLVQDARSIQAISSAVGYDDVDFFRGLFRRLAQMTPTEYRARFALANIRGQARLQAP